MDLDVATGPVVQENESEDVVGRVVDLDCFAIGYWFGHDGGHLELEIDHLRHTVFGLSGP